MGYTESKKVKVERARRENVRDLRNVMDTVESNMNDLGDVVEMMDIKMNQVIARLNEIRTLVVEFMGTVKPADVYEMNVISPRDLNNYSAFPFKNEESIVNFNKFLND